MPCSNAAKTPNQLKFAGVPQTPEPISSISGPKFTILWGYVEDILLLNRLFPIVDICLSCEDIARRSCAMVPRWRFLATFLHPLFAASRVQHVSDMHLKFTLGHTMCGSMADIQSATAEIRRRKKKKPQDENIIVCPIPYGDHNKTTNRRVNRYT